MGQRASEDLRLFNFMVFHGPVRDEAGPVSLKDSPANFLAKPNFRISPMFDPSTALDSINAQQLAKFSIPRTMFHVFKISPPLYPLFNDNFKRILKHSMRLHNRSKAM